MALTDAIRVRIGELFPDSVEEVEKALEVHMASVEAAEHEHVLDAILDLSGSDRNDLDRYLKVAARDYREVLVMAAEASDDKPG